MPRLHLYREIWKILGREWINLASAAAWAGEHIPGPEHGKLNPNLQLSDEQQAAILAVLGRMDLFEGLQPADRRCDELLITGAKYPAMQLQAAMVLDRLRSSDPNLQLTTRWLIGLYGQRPRTDDQDGTAQEIYDGLSETVQQHNWVQEQWNLRHAEDANEPFGGPFGSEFELGILSLISATDGNIKVTEKSPCQEPQTLTDVPTRQYQHVQLWLHSGIDVIALNAPAIARPGKPSRPTTRSTMQYWLDNYGMLPDTKRLVVATVRVHGRRQVATVEQQVHEVRPDIGVYALSQTVDDPKEMEKLFPNAFGEVVRLLQKAAEEYLLA
jgi:hypothetical protein